MAGGTGGNQPDPDEIERRLRELSKEVGKPRVHEPSALERLAAAKQAQKKTQRKRDTGVLTALAVAFVLLAGGGIFTWLRVAPPSWLHHTAASATPSPQPTRATSHPSPFVTTVVKVHGMMNAGTARNSGIEVLRIKVDYLFTFAVEPPGKPADWMRVIQQQYGYVDFARWDDPGGTLEPLVSIGSGTAGVRCDARDGYIHPDFPRGAPDSVKASGTPQDPYSLATPSGSSGDGCHNTTRT